MSKYRFSNQWQHTHAKPEVRLERKEHLKWEYVIVSDPKKAWDMYQKMLATDKIVKEFNERRKS